MFEPKWLRGRARGAWDEKEREGGEGQEGEGVVEFLQMFIFRFIFLDFYLFSCVFAYYLCVFVYIFGFSSYKIDSLISGGAGGAPHPLGYQFYVRKIQKYVQKHTKNMLIHINICKNIKKNI